MDKEIEDLLISMLGDGLSEEEKCKLNRWLEQDSKNRLAYQDFVSRFLQLRWVQENELIDDLKAREIIFGAINRKKNRRFLCYSVAASVAALVLTTALFFLIHKEQPVRYVSVEPVLVRPQAKLFLSSGDSINLSTHSVSIKEENGATLQVSGEDGITYRSDTADLKDKAIYNKIVVPRGGEYVITLNDGTKVWLNAESELEFPVKFSGPVREISLKGEAYFRVKKDADHPFKVRSDRYSVQVYGTEFNLNAYDSERVELVLVEGSVGFRPNLAGKEFKMTPKQCAVTNVNTGKVEVKNLKDVDLYSYVAWISKDMVFMNESLESIMKKVARWYDIDVVFQHENAKYTRFDANVPKYAEIKEFLYFLERTSSVRFEIDGKTVMVSLQ